MFAIVSRLFSVRGLLILAGVAFSVGLSSGWYVKDKFAEAEKAAALAALVDAQQKATAEAIERHKATRALDAEVISNLMVELETAQSRERVIVKEVVKYVPEDPAGSCNLTRGAVGLLNNARGYSDAGGVPGPAELSDEESRAPSSLTQRAQVGAHIDAASRYEALRAKHNALIEWIERQQK